MLGIPFPILRRPLAIGRLLSYPARRTAVNPDARISPSPDSHPPPIGALSGMFHAIVEAAPNAIVMADAAGKIVLVNRQTEKAFGYSRSELLGQPVEQLLPTRFRRRHTAFREAYQHHPETRPMGAGRDLHGRRKDGAEFPVEVGLTPVETDAGPMTLAMIIDISERKHLEEERLRLEEQVLEVSENEQRRIGQDLHDDLCQQLAGIGCLARVAEQQIAQIAPSSAPLLAEIREMVTQANIRAREIAHGLVPAVLESEGLNAALQRLTSQVETLYHIPCDYRGSDSIELPCGRTAAHLYRIAQEAVANAVKHAHPSRIEIVLQRDSGRLTLEVNDDGVGIPPQSGISGSAGLGLRTMNHRASLLQADLFVSTRQPGGTSVICSLPLHGDPWEEALPDTTK